MKTYLLKSAGYETFDGVKKKKEKTDFCIVELALSYYRSG